MLSNLLNSLNLQQNQTLVNHSPQSCPKTQKVKSKISKCQTFQRRHGTVHPRYPWLMITSKSHPSNTSTPKIATNVLDARTPTAITRAIVKIIYSVTKKRCTQHAPSHSAVARDVFTVVLISIVTKLKNTVKVIHARSVTNILKGEQLWPGMRGHMTRILHSGNIFRQQVSVTYTWFYFLQSLHGRLLKAPSANPRD